MSGKPEQSFATSDPYFDDSTSIGNGFLRLYKHGGNGLGYYWMGEFVDKRGFVSVYRQADLTRLDVVAGGRMHMRSWQKFYGERTIARLARGLLTEHFGDPA